MGETFNKLSVQTTMTNAVFYHSVFSYTMIYNYIVSFDLVCLIPFMKL